MNSYMNQTFLGRTAEEILKALDYYDRETLKNMVLENFKTVAMTWMPIDHRPLASGHYIIAHRGHAESDHFLGPEITWAPGAKLGWQKVGLDGLHYFRPTHCAPLPEFATTEDKFQNRVNFGPHPIPTPTMSEACKKAFETWEASPASRGFSFNVSQWTLSAIFAAGWKARKDAEFKALCEKGLNI
jgi:hypothetical protein